MKVFSTLRGHEIISNETKLIWDFFFFFFFFFFFLNSVFIYCCIYKERILNTDDGELKVWIV